MAYRKIGNDDASFGSDEMDEMDKLWVGVIQNLDRVVQHTKFIREHLGSLNEEELTGLIVTTKRFFDDTSAVF